MLLGSLMAGAAAGIAAASVAVFAFSAPIWLGLLIWWALGTSVTALPVVAMLLAGDAATEPAETLVTA
jgi:hypothetical protein